MVIGKLSSSGMKSSRGNGFGGGGGSRNSTEMAAVDGRGWQPLAVLLSSSFSEQQVVEREVA